MITYFQCLSIRLDWSWHVLSHMIRLFGVAFLGAFFGWAAGTPVSHSNLKTLLLIWSIS